MNSFLGTNPHPLSQDIPCRIRHSHPVIIHSTRHPLDSILPGIAPEDLTLTGSAVNVDDFVCATVKHLIKGLQSEAVKNLINESDHDTLSISLARLCPRALPLRTFQQYKTPIQQTILPVVLQCLPRSL